MAARRWGDVLLLALLCAWLRARLAGAEAVAQVLVGEVGAGNYSYYTLTRPGRVTLLLESVAGDADLYASVRVERPTFALGSHDFQSATCGVDRVSVGAREPRPLAIAVYGHPSHELTTYQLTVILEGDDGATAESSYADGSDPSSDYSAPGDAASAESSESSFLHILGSLLKFFLEVVVDIML